MMATAAPVQLAQLTNRADLAEMRIGMNTPAFGNVEVHAVVHANDVGVVIGTEKGDLRGLLQNEVPVIANTLQEQNLRLHSVNFMQGFAFSNDAAGGGNSQQRFFATRVPANSPAPESSADDSSDPPPPVYGTSVGSLSILA